jgi:branched-subunit amino acid transport protein
MSMWTLVVVVALITIGSRIVSLAVLPSPPTVVAAAVDRLPAPLFAALAAHSLAGAGAGALPDPTVLVAASLALMAALRWPSLLITLVAGLGGFAVASLVL